MYSEPVDISEREGAVALPLTTALSAELNKLAEEANTEEGMERFTEMTAALVQGIERYQSVPKDQQVAVVLGDMLQISEQVDADAKKSEHKVSCRKGCAHCCHLPVALSNAEADLLAQAVDSLTLAEFQHLERQARVGDDEYFMKLTLAQRRCVFLQNDNTCGVYEYRPFSCRKMFVVTPPDDCDTVKNPGGRVGQWVDRHMEMAASAAMAGFGCGSMAQLLVPRLRDKVEIR